MKIASFILLFVLISTFAKEEAPCRTKDGRKGRCRLPVHCFGQDLESSTCTEHRVCCTEINNKQYRGTFKELKFLPKPAKVTPVRNLKVDSIKDAFKIAEENINSLSELEDELQEKHAVVSKGTSAFIHQLFLKGSPVVRKLGRKGLKIIRVAQALIKKLGISKKQLALGISFPLPPDLCLPTPQICIPTKYRSFDGRCNNLQNPDWGKTKTALIRLAPSDYSDGIFAPRKAVSGADLPSARGISSEVATDVDNSHKGLTLMVMQWGQFLDHDVSHVPVNQISLEPVDEFVEGYSSGGTSAVGTSAVGISCCKDGQIMSPLHELCFPITIPEDDPFYSQFNQQCMEFVRSVVAPSCMIGPAQQLNQISHYLDSSNIYGSDEKEAEELRDSTGGRLKVSASNFLPIDEDLTEDECFSDNFETDKCYKAGDGRVNEQPNLAVLHTVWMREHNRVADELASLNPLWSHERLYQEARRIVNAEWQHMTYNEWLPVILGTEFSSQHGLLPLLQGYSDSYDPLRDASIFNEFATAAFRFGHSLVKGIFSILQLKLRENFFNPSSVKASFDVLVESLVQESMQNNDRHFTEEITNHLFERNDLFGMDLVALNIQRGRDHGIPGYNDIRKVCGLNKIKSFKHLNTVINPNVAKKLKTLYDHVDDIDLFVGGFSELTSTDDLLGPTFHCIIGAQFQSLKFGDRFFYEYGNQLSSFNKYQLQQIRNANVARLLCDNTNIGSVQPLVFRTTSDSNSVVSCDDPLIPKVDLSVFQE